MKVLAPGKLILSGEHAVVYGKPALAMAVNRHVKAVITQENLPQILFDLSDLAYKGYLSIDSLRHLKEKIKRKYSRFIRGEYSIRQVLQKPFELAQVALGLCAEALNLTLPHGVKIHVQSDIPIGCGMGSSAATIVSVIQAISLYFHVTLSKETLYHLALETENMQHGYSSGLDLRVALQGGCLFVNESQILSRTLPTCPLYLVNTGTPKTTTGQCVEKVAPIFKTSSIGDDFAQVTIAMDRALQNQDWQNMYSTIAANHRLLCQIGVVPEKVQEFITLVEKNQGAAKICGAGAVEGVGGGMVLVVGMDKHALYSLCEQYEYVIFPLLGESRGVHAV